MIDSIPTYSTRSSNPFLTKTIPFACLTKVDRALAGVLSNNIFLRVLLQTESVLGRRCETQNQLL